MDSVVTTEKNMNKRAHESGDAFSFFLFFEQLTHTRDKPHSRVYIIDFVEHCFLRNGGFHFAESTGAYINLLFIWGGRETHDRKDMK